MFAKTVAKLLYKLNLHKSRLYENIQIISGSSKDEPWLPIKMCTLDPNKQQKINITIHIIIV